MSDQTNPHAGTAFGFMFEPEMAAKMDRMAQMQDRSPTEIKDPVWAYAVIHDRGGLAGVWFNLERARGYAKATDSAVVALPVVEDYREVTE